MTFQEYTTYFKSIIDRPAGEQQSPYDNPAYLDYTKLNWARMNRWLKTGQLSAGLKEVVKAIDRAQQWIVITEPWCGDAAHSVPFIELASRENPLISVSYELRDSEPFRINEYLTGGSKSIPKLVVRDQDDKDLGSWGPRPLDCQVIYSRLQSKKADFEEIKTSLQHWYNANKGKDLQDELTGLLSASSEVFIKNK